MKDVRVRIRGYEMLVFQKLVYVNFCVRIFSPWEIPVSKCLSGKAKFHYKETRKQNENYLTLLPKYSSIKQSCKYFLVLDFKKLHYREKENLVQIFLNATMQWFKKDPSQWKIAWKIFPRKRKKGIKHKTGKYLDSCVTSFSWWKFESVLHVTAYLLVYIAT